jgi:hypothetical protein
MDRPCPPWFPVGTIVVLRATGKRGVVTEECAFAPGQTGFLVQVDFRKELNPGIMQSKWGRMNVSPSLLSKVEE